MNVLLLNDGFGFFVILILIALIVVVSFGVPFWLLSLVAPLWVSIPASALVACVAVLVTVKFRP